MSESTTIPESTRRRVAREAKPLDLPEVIHLPGPAMNPPGEALIDHEPPAHKTRSGSENRARPFVMFVRVTEAEHEEMEQAARAAGVEIGTYARESGLSEPETRRGGAHVTKRPKSVAYRVSAEERQRIKDWADAAGLTPGSYIRARSLKHPVTLTTRRPPVEKAELGRLLGQQGRISSNLNQLAFERNSGGVIADPDLRETLAESRAASRAIIRALSGRGE